MSFQTETSRRITNGVFRFSDLALEIQLLIFKQFDRPSLHSAVQVNRLWCDLSAIQIWREPPMSRVRKLASLQPLQRRQYYASKIRILNIRGLGIASAFDNLVFSSLEILWLHDYDLGTTAHLVPFLQSSIRTLCFRGRDLDSQLLPLIASCCPLLRRLRIRGPLENIDDTEFASFIQSLSSLRNLVLGCMFNVSAATAMFKTNRETLAPRLEALGLMDLADFPDPEPFRRFMMNCRSLYILGISSRAGIRPLMDSSVLSHVVNSNPLQHLHGNWLGLGLLGHPLASTSARFFGALRSLNKWGCSSSALFTLRQASSYLRVLELGLYDITTELFTYLGTQKQLRYLAITPWTRDEVFSFTHLSALSSLTLLVHLEITYLRRSARSSRIHGLDDSTFSQLISGFSQLKTLILDLDSPHLGVASIKSLSQACPLLERCALLYDHDLSTWVPTQTVSSPLFPNLVSLYLGSVADFARAGLSDIGNPMETLASSTGDNLSILSQARVSANILLSCVPCLERFGVERITMSATALQLLLAQTKPCKRLRAGDVAETPITTVQGKCSYDDFKGHDWRARAPYS